MHDLTIDKLESLKRSVYLGGNVIDSYISVTDITVETAGGDSYLI